MGDFSPISPQEEVMSTEKSPSAGAETAFPFQLQDLVGWVAKRKDGTAVKYVLDAYSEANATSLAKSTPRHATVSAVNYGGPYKWCKHNPAPEPVFVHPSGKWELYIADYQGARDNYKEFDWLIDGGNVVSDYDMKLVLKGDPIVARALMKHNLLPAKSKCRIVHIDWIDRAAPDLHPRFWIDLATMLKGRVLTCCQGGHGRSGTALVSLMMTATDYSPLDAITHLRAIHCPRAIESIVQHEYLNWLAQELDRPQDALLDSKVQDFKARFLTEMKSSFAKPYQERLIKLTDAPEEPKK